MSVQGSVAAFVVHPSGYDNEIPCCVEVKLSVSGGGGTGDGAVDAGAADAGASEGATDAGGWLAGPPTFEAGEPMNWEPRKRTAITAAAPRPIGTSLLTVGTLHGPMTTRCRSLFINAGTDRVEDLVVQLLRALA
jgi:hypothetical protein